MNIYHIITPVWRAVVAAPTPEDSILLLANYPSHSLPKTDFFNQPLEPTMIGYASPGISRVLAMEFAS
jgi:hypothetical protein